MIKKIFVILATMQPLFAQIAQNNNNMILVQGQQGTKYGFALTSNADNPFIRDLLSEQYGYSKTYNDIKVPDFYLDRTEVSIRDYREFIKDFAWKLCQQIASNPELMSNLPVPSSTPLQDELDKIWKINPVLKEFYDFLIVDKSKNKLSMPQLRVNVKAFYGKAKSDEKNTLYFSYDNEGDKNLKEIIIGDYRPGRIARDNDILSILVTNFRLSHALPSGIEDNADVRLLFYLLPFVESQKILNNFYFSDGLSDGLPIFGVDYYCAMFYAAWKNKRLPTELEYETAGKLNPKGKESNKLMDAVYPVQFKDIAGIYRLPANYKYEGKSGADYKFVDDENYKQNGFYHLVGNVAEWMADSYNTNPYTLFTNYNNVSPYEAVFKHLVEKLKTVFGIENLLNDQKCTRGGNYNSVLFYLRIQTRVPVSPFYRSPTIGFRCAK